MTRRNSCPDPFRDRFSAVEHFTFVAVGSPRNILFYGEPDEKAVIRYFRTTARKARVKRAEVIAELGGPPRLFDAPSLKP
jgi:hypothetical protein